jgi:hypothetical protein
MNEKSLRQLMKDSQNEDYINMRVKEQEGAD